ncbi:MAG: DNA polymerase III subunit beta [Aestuariivirga sp.]|uniref:DNA polymerase III subunit beta n=1 Tax=Aestuariivirga sp. TaxID=2650926 RepID=UPI0025BAFF41|nr:DNA polymerase III subunit beta [Aestuariivirga sp.]MCA3559568.1 DNA polymerase III subunit beta [Aestuariivirga sp.]
MRVTIERSAFLRALTHVQSVVERRNTIPILSNVLLQAGDGHLKLTATDLDIEIVESVPAEVARSGAATVPAHMLYDIVRKLPDGAQLELEQAGDGQRVAIFAGRSRFALQALPHEDFPDLAAGDFPHNFAISAADLRGLIEKTRFAISTEETRYYLNGIYFHDVAAGSLLRAVATDGHRLAQAQIARPDGAKGMPGVIVPRKTVLEVVKLFDGIDGAVEVSLSAAKIRFAAGDLVLTSKLIDGTFPDYERVIPRNNDKKLELDTKAFAAAVDRVSTISQEKGRAVKLAIGGNKVLLTVNNPDSGSAEEEVACSYDADPIDIGFNSRYLLDVAGQMKSDGLELQLADAGSPTIVRDPTDGQALYVLMPMRV